MLTMNLKIGRHVEKGQRELFPSQGPRCRTPLAGCGSQGLADSPASAKYPRARTSVDLEFN